MHDARPRHHSVSLCVVFKLEGSSPNWWHNRQTRRGVQPRVVAPSRSESLDTPRHARYRSYTVECFLSDSSKRKPTPPKATLNPKLKYLITVCTGAGLAARAGVLDGKKATTNKALWKETTDLRPSVEWVKEARYVVDGNCWTSAGVSAGIDVTLAWIAHIWGQDEARKCANRMEYEWRDDKHWDPFAYMFPDQ